MSKKITYIIGIIGIVLLIFGFITVNNQEKNKTIRTNASILSNKKIGWGIKRNDNHEQPDLGSENKALVDKYNGIAMGNNEKKYIYLTFDEGYEAGYTASILDTLKNNKVRAAFFITGHYLNTSEELVKRMIDEGHVVRKSYCKSL